MKRPLVLLLIFIALAISACANSAASSAEPADTEDQVMIASPEPVPPEEPEPTPEPTPAWERGIAAGYGIGLLYGKADRGTEVDITAELEGYYCIQYDGTELFVEKSFVRDITAGKPAERSAYSRYGAEIFPGPYLDGEPLEKPAMNTKLTVLDEFGDLMLVKTGRSEGYIDAAYVSPVWVTWQNGGSESGDSGQNSGNAYSGGSDGGDITLGKRRTDTAVPELLSVRFEPQSSDKLPERGVILADGTELYLGIVYPGDELMVLGAEGKKAEIYTAGGTGTLPRWAVLLGDEEPYSTWTGYAAYGARLYASYRLAGRYEDVWLNTELTVVLETDNGYFIQLSDGRYGYMDKAAVSRTVTVIDNEAPAAPEPAAEWTVPVL